MDGFRRTGQRRIAPMLALPSRWSALVEGASFVDSFWFLICSGFCILLFPMVYAISLSNIAKISIRIGGLKVEAPKGAESWKRCDSLCRVVGLISVSPEWGNLRKGRLNHRLRICPMWLFIWPLDVAYDLRCTKKDLNYNPSPLIVSF